MPPIYTLVRIQEVIITNQWSGYFDPQFFSSAATGGFPGLQVPSSLITLASDLTGDGFFIDLGNGKWDELRRCLPPLFQNKAQGRGPSEGGEWALYTDLNANPAVNGDPTMSGHIRWLSGANANGIAYPIGRLVNGNAVRYEKTYRFENNQVGLGSYWAQFLIT